MRRMTNLIIWAGVFMLMVSLFGNALGEGWIMCQPDSYVNIRETPGNRGAVIGYLELGDSVETDGQNRNGYTHIIHASTESGEGWVASGYLVQDRPQIETVTAWVDAAGAILVALFILHVAWEIAYPALQELVDAEIGGKSAAVESLARNVAGVVEVHKIRVRRYGGAYVADLHVHVDARLSVAEGHRIGHDVSDALLASDLGIVDAVVHVEPAKPARTIALPS